MVASRTPLLRLGMRHVPPTVQKPCQGHKPRRARLTDTMSSPGAHIVPCCDNVSAQVICTLLPRLNMLCPATPGVCPTWAWLSVDMQAVVVGWVNAALEVLQSFLQR
jgi:hypothetical protein